MGKNSQMTPEAMCGVLQMMQRMGVQNVQIGRTSILVPPATDNAVMAPGLNGKRVLLKRGTRIRLWSGSDGKPLKLESSGTVVSVFKGKGMVDLVYRKDNEEPNCGPSSCILKVGKDWTRVVEKNPYSKTAIVGW